MLLKSRLRNVGCHLDVTRVGDARDTCVFQGLRLLFCFHAVFKKKIAKILG